MQHLQSLANAHIDSNLQPGSVLAAKFHSI